VVLVATCVGRLSFGAMLVDAESTDAPFSARAAPGHATPSPRRVFDDAAAEVLVHPLKPLELMNQHQGERNAALDQQLPEDDSTDDEVIEEEIRLPLASSMGG
jgi:hypothetical protein